MTIRLPHLTALILGALGVFYGTSTPGLKASPAAGVTTIDKEYFDLASTDTTKLVSFYSPDCPISQKDIAKLSALHHQFQQDSVDVIAVAMPYDSADRISELEAEHEISYHLAHDADGTIAAAFPNVRFTPTTFLINNEGNIIWRHTGSMRLEKITEELSEAISNR